MINKPKISIITVVYNGIECIEKTILNVLKQTYENIEYIVVDGGSTDGTIEVLNKYSKQISYWISESDEGIYDAMNKAVTFSTGEWIIFRNCGDYFFSPTILNEIFCIYRDNGEDFIAGNVRYFKANKYKDFVPAILNKHYFEGMPFFHPATLIRRKTQNKYPFSLKYKQSSDYHFFIQALEDGAKYYYIDKIIALFDNRYGVSTEKNDISQEENISILQSFKAPQTYINSRINILKRIKTSKKVAKIPFLKKLIKIHKEVFCEWEKDSLDNILKNI